MMRGLFVFLFSFLHTDALLLRKQKLVPVGYHAEIMRGGGATVDHGHDIGPECRKGGMACADIECLPPFKLKRNPGQCCPTCFAPDHVVPIDRRGEAKGATGDYGGRQTEDCPDVWCFPLMCGYGQDPVPGPCCPKCGPR